jgi:hypothetical protein
MYNTIRHLFDGVRPFDWLMLVIEVMVLVFVAYEVIAGFIHGREVRKRQRELESRIHRTNQFVSQGQLLQKTVVRDGRDVDRTASLFKSALQWRSDVASWIMDTNGFLKECSTQASAKFLDDSLTFTFRDTSNKYCPETEASYETVNRRLNNLQSIVQNPLAYL